jgi:hypothetical protein
MSVKAQTPRVGRKRISNPQNITTHRPTNDTNGPLPKHQRNDVKQDSQPVDLWRMSSLNTVSFALPRITSNNAKIGACDGEDCATIFGIWVEGTGLR